MSNESDVTKDSTLFFGEKLYLKLKFISLMIMPAAITLALAVGQLYEWDGTLKLVGLLTASNFFLSVILGISTKTYNASDAKYDGEIKIQTNEAGLKLYSLELKNAPATLDDKAQVVFKVKPDGSSSNGSK